MHHLTFPKNILQRSTPAIRTASPQERALSPCWSSQECYLTPRHSRRRVLVSLVPSHTIRTPSLFISPHFCTRQQCVSCPWASLIVVLGPRRMCSVFFFSSEIYVCVVVSVCCLLFFTASVIGLCSRQFVTCSSFFYADLFVRT